MLRIAPMAASTKTDRILEALPLAEAFAGTLAKRSGARFDEAKAIAALELVESIDDYDPSLSSLTTFLYRRISWALADQARRDHWLTRPQQERPQSVTLAALTRPDVLDGRAASLPDPSAEEAFEEVDDELEREWLRRKIPEALAELSPKARYVLEQRVAGVPAVRLAEDLGVDPSRISQIATKASIRVRELLAA